MSTTRYLCITCSVMVSQNITLQSLNKHNHIMVSQNITLQSLNKHNHRNKYITSTQETKSCRLQGTYTSLVLSWFRKTLHYSLSTNKITETSTVHHLKKHNHVNYNVFMHHLSSHGFTKHYITMSQQT